MMEMLAIYWTTVLAGTFMAGALSLLGIQLAARDRAMQTVCVGQGASVGVIIGIGFSHYFGWEEGMLSALPFFTGLGTSALTYAVSDRLVRRRHSSRNTLFAFVFALLLALGHLVGSLFPGLETHLSQIYFGDLSTLTNEDSYIALFVGVGVSLFLLAGMKRISLFSFDAHLVGEAKVLQRESFYVKSFPYVALGLVCLSVQFLGFLFTIALLFVPTSMLSFFPVRGLRRHYLRALGVAAIGAAAGFLLSLKVTRLPTVPSVVAMTFLILLVMYLIEIFTRGSTRS